MTEPAQEPRIPEEDRLRAGMYDFLGTLLARPPDEALLRKSATLTGDDSEVGRAIQTLGRIAASTAPQAVEEEYNTLFVGLGRGELLPYGSYYFGPASSTRSRWPCSGTT